MPIVDTLNTTPPSGKTSGLTPAMMIEMADRHTERRAKNVLDLPREFVQAAQKFIREHQWYWRRVTARFTTQPGVALYDLTDQLPDGVEFERIMRQGVKLIVSKDSKPALTPVHDPEAQDDLLEDDAQGRPTAYMLERGEQQTIRLSPIPDGAYTVRVTGWATVNHELDLANMPLVPGHLHEGLVLGLECRIFKFLLGEGSAKYLAASKEYEDYVAHCADMVDFADGVVQEWKTTASNQDAIQSS